jgi:AraC-like DNA-binding protein
MTCINKVIDSHDPDQCSEEMSLIARNVSFRADQGHGFNAQINISRLPRIGLFSIDILNSRITQQEERDFVAVSIGLKGEFISWDQGHPETFGSGECHILNTDVPLKFLQPPSSYNSLVVNFYKPLLDQFEGKLNGGAEPSLKQFDSRLSLYTAAGASFWRYLSHLWAELQRGGTLLQSPQATAEAENTLFTLFLQATGRISQKGNGVDALRGSELYVKRAEEYVREKLADEICRADVAEVAGVSYPTLVRAFRKHHGQSPMQFVKQRRLEQVQRELIAADPKEIKVTPLALKYGFHHLGQFSLDYRKACGESPSETLRQ